MTAITTKRTSTKNTALFDGCGNDDLTGKQLGNYRLTQRLSQNGAATLYRATNMRYKFPLTLKVLNAEFADDKQYAQMFTNEFNLGISLKHVGLPKYFELGDYEGRPFMVTEFFGGIPFNQLTRQSTDTLKPRIQEIFTQIAEIINYLHSQKIIHLDIKPGIFQIDLERNRLKLCDLSTARREVGRLRSFFTFGERPIVGTAAYISPEAIQKKNPNPQMDIYSMGSMLFEYFAGRAPFVGANANAVMNQKLMSVAPKLGQFNPDISQELERLVARMLSQDTTYRPASMAHFIATFNRLKIYNY